MLGINDPWIILAYLTCIASAIVCIVYGIYNWNRGADDEANEISEEGKWEKDEIKIEETL
jgi:hypothetical protein